MVDGEARVLITGASGMLGRAVLTAAPVPAHGVDRAEGDLTSGADIARLFASPWAGVIHCAGYTDVDGAERDPRAAHAGNVVATRELATAAAAASIPLVVVSTDYVFGGDSPESRTENDRTDPRGVYARTKRAAEEAATRVHPTGTRIVRTAWLYGAGGRNFVDAILRVGSEGKPLSVVHDQRGTPTWTHALAPALWFVLLHAPPGTYHCTCEGSATWYEFARKIIELAGMDAELAPCTTEEYPRPAPRPASSVLDSGKLARLRAERLPPWQEALREYMGTIGALRTKAGE